MLVAPSDRREMIRQAASRIATKRTADKARVPLGAPKAKAALQLAPQPFEVRQAHLPGAIAFLKARGVLVDVSDRAALVRKYRVSGKRDLQLADDVIQIAADLGFEVPHA